MTRSTPFFNGHLRPSGVIMSIIDVPTLDHSYVVRLDVAERYDAAFLVACEAAPAVPLWARLARLAESGGWQRDADSPDPADQIIGVARDLARVAGAPAAPELTLDEHGYIAVLRYVTCTGTEIVALRDAEEIVIAGRAASVLRRALAVVRELRLVWTPDPDLVRDATTEEQERALRGVAARIAKQVQEVGPPTRYDVESGYEPETEVVRRYTEASADDDDDARVVIIDAVKDGAPFRVSAKLSRAQAQALVAHLVRHPEGETILAKEDEASVVLFTAEGPLMVLTDYSEVPLATVAPVQW